MSQEARLEYASSILPRKPRPVSADLGIETTFQAVPKQADFIIFLSYF